MVARTPISPLPALREFLTSIFRKSSVMQSDDASLWGNSSLSQLLTPEVGPAIWPRIAPKRFRFNALNKPSIEPGSAGSLTGCLQVDQQGLRQYALDKPSSRQKRLSVVILGSWGAVFYEFFAFACPATYDEVMTNFTIAGGKIRCLQCQAISKRTLVQCKAPAIAGRKVCRFHGGLSTGPKTPEGRQRCSDAKTIHGQDTRAIRERQRDIASHLRALEALCKALRMFC